MDVFSDVAVVASSAAWVELHRNTIEKLITSTLGCASEKGMRVIWRTNLEMLQLEGIEPARQQADATEVLFMLFRLCARCGRVSWHA